MFLQVVRTHCAKHCVNWSCGQDAHSRTLLLHLFEIRLENGEPKGSRKQIANKQSNDKEEQTIGQNKKSKHSGGQITEQRVKRQ